MHPNAPPPCPTTLALGSPQIWAEWFTYAVLAYFVVTVAFWLYRLNAALGKYDPLFIIPLLQASYIVLATLAGGIYFQEFETLEWWQVMMPLPPHHTPPARPSVPHPTPTPTPIAHPTRHC